MGLWLEEVWHFIENKWKEWQDRKVGREVAEKREAVVSTKRKKTEQSPPAPVRIEPAVTEVPKSNVSNGNGRQALFADMSEGLIPPVGLLDPPSGMLTRLRPKRSIHLAADRAQARRLRCRGQGACAYPGPVITRYEIEPATGVKGSQVVNLAKDLARALSLVSIRVVETIPASRAWRSNFRIPNARRCVCRDRASKAYRTMSSPLTVALGKGHRRAADRRRPGQDAALAGCRHDRIGEIGRVNAMILSLLYKSEPDRVRLIMVDPKMLELDLRRHPHLLAPVVTRHETCRQCAELVRRRDGKRYKLMAAVGVRNLAGFNKQVQEARKRVAAYQPVLDHPGAPSRWSRCRTSWWWSTSSQT